MLDQGIDTSTAVGRIFFQILGAIAEFEHALMSERTRDGLAAARARGRTGGQKPTLGPRPVTLARQMYDELGHDDKRRYTVAEIAAEFGVTIYPRTGARAASGHGSTGRSSPDPGMTVYPGRVLPAADVPQVPVPAGL